MPLLLDTMLTKNAPAQTTTSSGAKYHEILSNGGTVNSSFNGGPCCGHVKNVKNGHAPLTSVLAEVKGNGDHHNHEGAVLATPTPTLSTCSEKTKYTVEIADEEPAVPTTAMMSLSQVWKRCIIAHARMQGNEIGWLIIVKEGGGRRGGNVM